MSDTFLDAHKLGPRLYSVGGRLNPVSIRDQMIRGELFVRRAAESGLLQRDGKDRLLIVGAGAAGVAAALEAAALDVPTLLIDKGNQGFAPQSKCPTRWIDPTVYDFPVDHWKVKQYPLSPKSLHQLAWGPGVAQVLAFNWWTQFRAAALNWPHLEFRNFTTLTKPPALEPNGNYLEVELHRDIPLLNNPQTTTEPFTLVLVATGVAREKTYLRAPGGKPHDAWGYAFWQADEFAKTSLGLPAGVAPRVLISGSGDGALQDFLRVTTTCATAEEIYDRINAVQPITSGQLARIHSAKARALRTWHWGLGPRHDHDVLRDLHRKHERVADEVLQAGGAQLKAELDSLLRNPLPQVRMIYECDHFSHAYCINRFVALMIGKFLEQRFGPDTVLLAGRRLIDIRSADPNLHRCNCDATLCHGNLHVAEWHRLPDCRYPPDTTQGGHIDANVLILRHGIDNADLPWDPTPTRSRHLLSFST